MAQKEFDSNKRMVFKKRKTKWFKYYFIDKIPLFLIITYFPISVNEKPKDVRLPIDITPTLYDLTIKPYIGASFGDKSFTFEGSMKIHFTCTKPTNKIIFHLKDLNFKNETIKLSSSNDSTLSIVLPWANDFQREFFIANFSRNCSQGVSYILNLEYVGQISKNLVGFYRSSYVDKTTNQTY